MISKQLSMQPALLRLAYKVDGLRVQARGLNLLRRYSPDQPRVPSGRPDGGQWTPWIGRTHPDRRRVAQGRVKFSGALIRQDYDSALGAFRCVYYDSRHDYRFTVVIVGDKCPSGYIGY